MTIVALAEIGTTFGSAKRSRARGDVLSAGEPVPTARSAQALEKSAALAVT